MQATNLYFAILIGAGGFFGTLLRYLVYQNLTSTWGLNTPTLVVNILGSACIGVAYACSLHYGSHFGFLVLMTGVLGGFTTFSAFSMDTLMLLRDQRYFLALSYVFIMIFVGLCACVLGFYLTKSILKSF